MFGIIAAVHQTINGTQIIFLLPQPGTVAQAGCVAALTDERRARYTDEPKLPNN